MCRHWRRIEMDQARITSGNTAGRSEDVVQKKTVTGPKGTTWSVLLRGGPIIALLFLLAYLSFASPHFATLNNFKTSPSKTPTSSYWR